MNKQEIKGLNKVKQLAWDMKIELADKREDRYTEIHCVECGVGADTHLMYLANYDNETTMCESCIYNEIKPVIFDEEIWLDKGYTKEQIKEAQKIVELDYE